MFGITEPLKEQYGKATANYNLQCWWHFYKGNWLLKRFGFKTNFGKEQPNAKEGVTIRKTKQQLIYEWQWFCYPASNIFITSWGIKCQGNCMHFWLGSYQAMHMHGFFKFKNENFAKTAKALHWTGNRIIKWIFRFWNIRQAACRQYMPAPFI